MTNYAQNLVEESNILGRLLELLEEMDLDKEVGLKSDLTLQYNEFVFFSASC